jgi:IclR family acetate operon transcriptional repressor
MQNDTAMIAALESKVHEAEKSPYVITSAYRTLLVLQAFVAPPHRFSLAELISRTGIEKNQLYRSLKTLEQAGFLESDSDSRFVLTPLLHQLSFATIYAQRQSLVSVAKPYLDEVVELTKESVHLFVRAGDVAVCIDARESPQLVRVASILGISVPLHVGAVPKAILAFLPPEAQAATLKQLERLPRYTAKTIRSPEQLRATLAQIRQQGYAISDEDYDASARGVGAPIFDDSGNVVGGISVGGPSFRISDEVLADFAQLITRVAQDISRKLGYSS